MREAVCSYKAHGFSLIEMMVALAILAFGFLAMGPLLYLAAGSGSLARSKEAAAIAAQNKLESLADLYRRNPLAGDLTPGSHGPQQIQMVNPMDGTTLNRFSLSWTVSAVADPRPGKTIHARQVRVKVTPIQPGGASNSRPALNKILNVTTIFSQRIS